MECDSTAMEMCVPVRLCECGGYTVSVAVDDAQAWPGVHVRSPVRSQNF